jgi:hypothetical protein
LLHFRNAIYDGDCKTLRGTLRIPSMRNPDKWSPTEPEEPDVPGSPGRDVGPDRSGTRRGALAGLVLILLLVAGGLLLTRVLRGMSQLQDCALSGRSNCS